MGAEDSVIATLRRLRDQLAELWSEPFARLLVIVVILVPALTLVILAFLVRPSTRPPQVLRGPITVRQTLTPTTALFGDRIQAEIDIYSDRAQIDPRSVIVKTDFRPYRAAVTNVERAQQGGVSLLRTQIALDCLTPVCVPPSKRGRLFHFPQLTVSYSQAGTRLELRKPWPSLQVYSRIGHDPSQAPSLEDSPPSLSTRLGVSAELARIVLAVLAGLLALVGALLVATGFWPRFFYSLRQWRRLTPLEQALVQLEAAAEIDDEAIRRRVLDQLANRLGEAELLSLERQSRELAWGQSPPHPDEIDLLQERIRAGLNGGRR